MKRPAIIITGGAKRVGAAMALYFAEAGYDIALHYNTSKTDALKLQKKIIATGAACEIFAQDLSKISQLPAFMASIKKAMPNCTTLVNNASIFERKEFLKTDEKFFDDHFAVNLKAPFFLTQTFAKTFKKGSVINILDTDISKNNVSHFAYLLSKKSLADFTKMAALAIGPDVRVNGVAPGILLPSNELDTEYMKRLAKAVPLKKLGQLQDVLEAAHFFAEQQGVTGQLIYIDGGQHLL